VWVEYLTGVTNNGAPVRGNYSATVVDANTLDLTGTVFGGGYIAGSGLVALAAAPASNILLLSQFINCQDYAELTSEITAGRGQTVVGQGMGVVLTGATASSTNIGTVTANVAGQAAHDAAVSGNPVRIAGSFTRNEPLEEAITVSVSAKPTYSTNPPAWMTTT
jgi:hypothetical protein